MQDLLIFPLGGNSTEALDCLDGQFNLLGFVDDDVEKIGIKYFGREVFDRSAFQKYPDAKILACVGNSKNFHQRKTIIEGLNIDNERFVSIIHPRASISKFAQIGKNCLIMAGVAITYNAIIEDNVVILPNSVIHHDTKIGNATCIGSNVVVAGFTQIGASCYVGSGSNIINNITIGEKVMIGMGANVLKSVGANQKIAGNPARIL